MRLSDIITLGKQYLLLGAIFATILTIFLCLGYFFIYKRILKGNRKITREMIIWFILFVCYLFVVIGATMLSRGSWYENTKIQPLLYSYKEAWNNFEPREWRNIILNILLFVPFGFLLPIGIEKFRVFWKTYLLGFIFTLGIETIQLLLKRGIFELDDILNNTVGTMIGYGCFAICMFTIAWIKGRQKYLKRTMRLQLPLFIVMVSFGMIFVAYTKQDLGNLSISYITKINKKHLMVSSDKKYSNSQKSVAVYKTKQYSQKETYEFTEKFFHSLGDTIDENRTDLYDETAVYYSVGGYSLWVDYSGGAFRFTDFNTECANPTINTMSNATKEDMIAVLDQYEIKFPDGVEFSNDGDGKYTFTANEIIANGMMYDGTFSCKYYENRKVGSMNGNILECQYEKDFRIISKKEAYKKIKDGKFKINLNSNQLNIKVSQETLEYILDTKGYYQPIYMFKANINGKDNEIAIPAIKEMYH